MASGGGDDDAEDGTGAQPPQPGGGDPGGSGVSGLVMRVEAVQELLTGLAEAAARFAAEERAAQAEVERCEAAEEALLLDAGSTPGSEASAVVRVLASARWRIAVATAKETRTVRREVVAWWADAAVYALLVMVRGWPVVDAARVGAAEPGRFYGPELLARLPPVDPHHRALTELALRMWHGSTDPADADLPALAQEAAERSGLSVRGGPDGTVELVEDGAVESRRCRLWGEVWAEYRIPDLPEEQWLIDLLTRLDVPVEVVAAAGSAARGYGQLRRAADRCTDVTSVDGWDSSADVAAEHDTLLEVLDTASDVLDAFARTLTAALPTLLAHRLRGEHPPP